MINILLFIKFTLNANWRMYHSVVTVQVNDQISQIISQDYRQQNIIIADIALVKLAIYMVQEGVETLF